MCVWLITNFRKMPRSQTDWLLVCNETLPKARAARLLGCARSQSVSFSACERIEGSLTLAPATSMNVAQQSIALLRTANAILVVLDTARNPFVPLTA